ncbi:MAG: hypothetical protein K0S61_3822 [Anaerocolumna sp.]|jgi:uncharacterized protein YdeI (YjbR/CyaY-like superfamily)|nr:hypothetical protein [Anaerocolumna sp.]
MDNSLLSSTQIPQGLGMALTQNLEALSYFSSLNSRQKQEVVNHTHSIRSKAEMQYFVSNMADETHFS